MNPKASFICVLLVIILTLSLSTIFLSASTATVGSSIVHVEQGSQTIQEAVNNATPGSVIQVTNGTYNEALMINKSITLIGQGIGKTILNGTLTTTAIQITANDVTVQGFTIQQFRTGIVVNQSHNILITENQITRILTKGATYIIDSVNVTLSKNTIANNYCPGVTMLRSNMTRFMQNNISHNSGVGIYFENSKDFVAIDNQIESNAGDAICVFYGYNLSIEGNTLALNGYRGIWAARSTGKVFHNNFLRNNENARSILSNFTWDNGYPSGGNYWSNYTGNDLYSGTNQNITGSDGIGDLPFTVPQEGERDNYPLMGNFTRLQATLATRNYIVEFNSNAEANNVSLNQTEKSLTFNIDNPNKTESFCRIAIPQALMWSNTSNQWIVTINDNPAQRRITEDRNQTYIYFTFSTGSYTVKITSTNMVPENFFSSVLVLLMAVSVALAMTYTRRRADKISPIHENFHSHVKNKFGTTTN